MGPEELQPHFEALVNERLNAIPITSNKDLKTTIVALRALGGGSRSTGFLSRTVQAAKAKLGLTSRETGSQSLPSEERIGQAVEGVRDLLDNPHKHVSQEHTSRFREVVRGQVASKISELETRSAAEDHGVIQLFDAINVDGKPDLAGISVQKRAAACRRWLQEHADRLNSVTEIDLGEKNLTVVPREIELFSNLQSLSLSNNQIQTLQGPPLPAGLQTLYLSDNQIQTLQGVALPAGLQALYLNDNRIQSLQGAALPAGLQTLDLSNNQIQSLQGPPLPAGLRSLSLSNNRIQSLQGVALPAGLQTLYLNDNQISELPDWVFQLPRTCQLYIEMNLFTPQYVEQINRRLAANPNSPHVTLSVHETPSDLASGQSLEERLDAWNKEHLEQFYSPCAENFDQLLALGDPAKSQLAKYLGRLRETKDYREGGDSRVNIVRRVGKMLRLASANTQFRDQMAAAIAEGLESCGDRVLIMFNDLEILCQAYQENMTEEQVRALAIGQARYELIKKYAQEEARERHLGDEIETILFFHLALRERLNLPISTQGMLYPRCSGVNKEMLDDITALVESFSDEALLARSPLWQEWQQKHQQPEVDRITAHYSELLEQAEELDKAEDRQEYLRAHNDLAKVLRPLGQPYNYADACQLIMQARESAIASIGKNSLTAQSSE